MSDLKRRLLTLHYKNKEEHVGSCFSGLEIIDDIFTNMEDDDIFILSCGHLGYALYVVLEKHYGIDAQKLAYKHGGHPHLDEDNKIYCSSGSLGLAITVAVGRAIGNPSRTVHVMISDGECAEGTVWESLRYIYEKNIKNIRVYVNMNGYAAYDAIDTTYLEKRLLAFLPDIDIRHTTVSHFPFLRGINAHYHIMSKEDYEVGLKQLS
jgi:transketolase